MSIRNTSKAVILSGGCVLLHRCRDNDGVYYDLPGGGQHLFETVEQALRREVYEETGLTVRPQRFLALAEEIVQDARQRQSCPQYCHRVAHIFLAETIPADAAHASAGCAAVSPAGHTAAISENPPAGGQSAEDFAAKGGFAVLDGLAAVEPDRGHEQTVWVPLAQTDALPLRPQALRGRLRALVEGRCGPWLGSVLL